MILKYEDQAKQATVTKLLSLNDGMCQVQQEIKGFLQHAVGKKSEDSSST